MRSRVVAALPLLAALAVHVAWTRSFQAEAAAAAEEYRRVRDERRQAVADLAREARLAAAPARVGLVAGASQGTPPARAARRLVVDTLAASGLENVKLRVTPGLRPRAGATVHLTGFGSLDEVARFTGELARPGNGLLLSSVGLVPRDGAVALSFEAVTMGPR